MQTESVRVHHAPTYFLEAAPAGTTFYPFYVFYGGTLYALAGILGALLGGSPIVAFVAFILAGVAASYGGLLWLAHQLGVRSWLRHAPAVTYVTSAYFVTNLYGRGAWPEFMATSAIPLALAAALRIARAPRLEPIPIVLLAISVIIWSGSHNISLAWGAVCVLVTVVLLRLLVGRPFAAGRRQLAWLAGVVVLAVCCNGWFLLPDLLYAGDTAISATAAFNWHNTGGFNTPRVLFNPLRYVPYGSSTPALYLQLPMWLLVWAIVAWAVLRKDMTRELRRAALALTIVLVGLVTLVLVPFSWEVVPATLKLIQFPYRLITYASLAVAGLVLVLVMAVERSPASHARLRAGTAVAIAGSAALCLWQLWVPETRHPQSYKDPRDALVSVNVAPRTWYDLGGYHDVGSRTAPSPGVRMVLVPHAALSGNRVTLTIDAPPGPEPFGLNTGALPGSCRSTGSSGWAGPRPATRSSGARTAGRGRCRSPTGPGCRDHGRPGADGDRGGRPDRARRRDHRRRPGPAAHRPARAPRRRRRAPGLLGCPRCA